MCASWWKRPESPARSDPGAAGEKAAARFLRSQGLRILKQNWRCPLGELDLICEEDEVLVIVEVKSSIRRGSIAPEHRVNRQKQRKLKALAEYYLKNVCREAKPVRFDVIAVWWEEEEPRVEHIRNAF